MRSSFAADDTDTIEQLKRQIQELDQKVRVLERKQEIDKEAATEKAKTSTSISYGGSGLTARSADSNFVFRLRGYVQADARFYSEEYPGGIGNDTFLMRRVRPIFDGTVYQKYDYRVMLDFGSGVSSAPQNNALVQDAYVTARFLPELQLQVGKMKEPVGLERLQSGQNLLFVERGYPTQLVPNRDVGIQLQGDLFENRLRYEAGYFNGVSDGGSGDFETFDDDKDGAARLFATPFLNSRGPLRGLGFGVAGTVGNQEGSLRNYLTPGQQRFFNWRSGTGATNSPNVTAEGQHWRVVPQAYWYWGPFGVYGEYAISDQEIQRQAGTQSHEQVRNTAWQVSASYLLTGEENGWRGFTPKNPFNPGNGGWGAWELAARVGGMDLDDAVFPLYANPANSATSAFSWGAGMNWYLNRNVKLSLNYEQTDFDGGESAFLQDGEKVVFGRVQLSF